jgi:hypothetical protein
LNVLSESWSVGVGMVMAAYRFFLSVLL